MVLVQATLCSRCNESPMALVVYPFGLAVVGDPAATLHFAEIGVVLMLFLIGLELDPKHLWKMRRAVFGAGVMQLVACAILLFAALLASGLPWQGALVAGLPHFKDEAKRTSMVRSARDELERQFERDRAALDRYGDGEWHADIEGADEERA